MIKIIEEGKKEFVGICRRCSCKFSYEVEDICVDYVTCPDCGYIYGWEHANFGKTCQTMPIGEAQPKTADNPFFVSVNTGDCKPL